MSTNSPLLAKRLIQPQWLSAPEYALTFGPEVTDICMMAGFEPDPEQQLLLDLTFAVGPNGKSVAFEVDVIAPRQQIKTGFLNMAELGWLFVTKERLIIHSAHELDAAEESFRLLARLIEDSPQLSAHLKPTRGERPGISEGNGRWSINLARRGDAPERRVKYKARRKDAGRALTGNKVVLDEAFALEPSHMGSLLPTLTSVPDPQVVKASSAGKTSSDVLRDSRDRGRAGGSRRQVYVEWGDVEAGTGCAVTDCTHEKTIAGCALDDESRWHKFMTALGRRTSVETIRAMRQAMPPAEFAREFMVWWDVEEDDTPPTIDLSAWADLSRPKAKQPERAVLSIDVEPSRATSTIGVAGAGKKGRTLVLSKTGEGTAWVVPAVVKLLEKRDIVEVCLHPSSQAGALIPALAKAGIDFYAMTATDLGQACAAFQMGITEESIEHVGQVELDRAVGNARTRWFLESERWDRRDLSISISPLVAVSAAAFRWTVYNDYDVEDSFL